LNFLIFHLPNRSNPSSLSFARNLQTTRDFREKNCSAKGISSPHSTAQFHCTLFKHFTPICLESALFLLIRANLHKRREMKRIFSVIQASSSQQRTTVFSAGGDEEQEENSILERIRIRNLAMLL
jgi:hypothetical protein